MDDIEYTSYLCSTLATQCISYNIYFVFVVFFFLNQNLLFHASCARCVRVSVYFFVLTEQLYRENVWSIIFSLSRIINDYSISISSVKTLNTKTFALFARLARSLTQWILHGNVLHRRPIHIAKHTHIKHVCCTNVDK